MEKNKKKLEEAELRVIQFELNDVIVASGILNKNNCDGYGGSGVCTPLIK